MLNGRRQWVCWRAKKFRQLIQEAIVPNIGVGEKIPAFELPDHEGRACNLAEQLEYGPVMLVFYRGDW